MLPKIFVTIYCRQFCFLAERRSHGDCTRPEEKPLRSEHEVHTQQLCSSSGNGLCYTQTRDDKKMRVDAHGYTSQLRNPGGLVRERRATRNTNYLFHALTYDVICFSVQTVTIVYTLGGELYNDCSQCSLSASEVAAVCCNVSDDAASNPSRLIR